MNNVIKTQYYLKKVSNDRYEIEYRHYQRSFFGLGNENWSAWNVIGSKYHSNVFMALKVNSKKEAKRLFKKWHKNTSPYEMVGFEVKKNNS